MRVTARRCRTSTPLIASSANASAISPTTSPFESRRTCWPDVARTPLVSTAATGTLAACHSGARLDNALANTAVAIAATVTRQSIPTSSARGM